MKKILLPVCSLAFAGLVASGEAEAKDYEPPTIVYQKSKADTLCKEVRGKASLRKTIDDNVRKAPKLKRTHARRITDEQCKFYTASKTEKQKYWNRTLDQLVERGLLTRADRKTLSRLPFDATVLEQWDPTTDFGKQIKAQSEEQPEAQANTGVGFVIGAIIGAAIGSGAGPGGIAPGIAIGGAAGNLTETAYNVLVGNTEFDDSVTDIDDGDGE